MTSRAGVLNCWAQGVHAPKSLPGAASGFHQRPAPERHSSQPPGASWPSSTHRRGPLTQVPPGHTGAPDSPARRPGIPGSGAGSPRHLAQVLWLPRSRRAGGRPASAPAPAAARAPRAPHLPPRRVLGGPGRARGGSAQGAPARLVQPLPPASAGLGEEPALTICCKAPPPAGSAPAAPPRPPRSAGTAVGGGAADRGPRSAPPRPARPGSGGQSPAAWPVHCPSPVLVLVLVLGH